MDIRLAYRDFIRRASGVPGLEPYDYQHRLAAEGLPELLAVPTGCGKTAAVVLGWLFRRSVHPDRGVRAATPHWLVYVLPQRVLVEQVQEEVDKWLRNTGLDLRCHVVMGGQRGRTWRDDLDRDAILVGTQDMLLSRALNRGYGDGQGIWPIDFGLLHSGCHWIMDEVQLMGPGLPTTRQLHGLRGRLGAAAPSASTWMSATVNEEALRTVDCPQIASRLDLGTADRTGPLARRLDAGKTIRRLPVAAGKAYAADLAVTIGAVHRPGRRTLVVLNTVDRARQVWEALGRNPDIRTVLVHSRFRPPDRKRQVDAALAPPGARGTIVVSTQVLEAGVDVSADVLVTEAAPWPSIVQRAGRCNRDGGIDDAQLLWVEPPGPTPYAEDDVAAAIEMLHELEGASTTPDQMAARTVPSTQPVHAVLRRRDLVELFDTLPDLSGNAIDVTRFVRDADDRSAEVAWWPLGDSRPTTRSLPERNERCPAPIGEVKKWTEGRNTWRFDHIEAEWVRCQPTDVRPGMVVVADVGAGGYRPATGWSPTSNDPVAPLETNGSDDCGLDDDCGTTSRRRWVSLAEHSADVANEAERLLCALDPPEITPGMREAAVRGARLHDIGKAHDVFQASLERLVRDSDRDQADAAGRPWAKSASNGRLRHSRPHFRHELASALVLLGDGARVLDDCAEPDLAVYLVASHHGRARLGVRSLPNEWSPPPERSGVAVVLGVADGDVVPAVELGDLSIPASRMDLSAFQLGAGADGSLSWAHRMLGLRDREDLGPFRLGFLEAVVRLADWHASAAADRRVDE